MKLDTTKTLVFDDKADGHHPEYIKNLCTGAATRLGQTYYFLVSKRLSTVLDIAGLEKSGNITFLFVEDFSEKWNPDEPGFRHALNVTRLLGTVAGKYGCKNIILVMLMSVMPFLPFLLSTKHRVSGIIYMIYLYRLDSGIFTRILDRLKYFLFSRCVVFNKVCILNDNSAAEYFNRKYRTRKFVFLPDPVVPFDKSGLRDLRQEQNLERKKIVLHFGCLSRDKGTLDILNFIQSCSAAECASYAFIFAGSIQNDIKVEFLQQYESLKSKVEIRLFDYFCSYEFLGSLCMTCDYILSPYKRVASSSGVIGYAAQFNKPVIVPASGLLGNLVVTYGLGFVYDQGANFNDELRRILSEPFNCDSNDYVAVNNVANFNAVLLS